MDVPLAHSARGAAPAQSYADHVGAVEEAAVANATAATVHDVTAMSSFVESVGVAATFHDLGKLNTQNQEVLARISHRPLSIRHEDAGVAHLWKEGNLLSAVLVAGHHQGLFEADCESAKERRDGIPALRIPDAYNDTEANLDKYLAKHREVVGESPRHEPSELLQGFALRVALSCLVDADHGDTARNYGNETYIETPAPRWGERVDSLKRYVAQLSSEDNERNSLRSMLFEECCGADVEPNIRACDAPVGSGKTLAVMAHLLRVAEAKRLRHIFVVLPYTNIIRQSVSQYRDALVLPGEDPTQVVAEHHHQADFESLEHRGLATLWKAPIVVTTAVQFFETLASNRPSKLRKLHELPRSAVFLDETHACIPPHLWRVTWNWIDEWLSKWDGHLVLASGSLPSFWASEDFVSTPRNDVPNLVSPALQQAMNALESSRIQPKREQDALDLDHLVELVRRTEGPRLLILNTVQNAAVVALEMRNRGQDVLHLSTALAPVHREPILDRVRARLADPSDRDWTLVATSCVEAGVDVSFRTAIRECASVASLIQTGGRVRRHMEEWQGELWSIRLSSDRFNRNKALSRSADVLDELLRAGAWAETRPSDLILEAWRRELRQGQRDTGEHLRNAERDCNYRTLANDYKVIEGETRLVVIDDRLADRLEEGNPVPPTELVRNSVHIWPGKYEGTLLRPIGRSKAPRAAELWRWTSDYDPSFIGYMAGALQDQQFLRDGGAIV